MTLETVIQMTVPERSRFAELEEVVETNIRGFQVLGTALTEIRDSKLYRESAPNFEEYVKGRWGIAKSHAYRMIGAAEIALNVDPDGDHPELKENHVRPLVGLSPSEQKETFLEAMESAQGERMTERHVKEALEKTGHTVRMKSKKGPVEWYTPDHIIELAYSILGDINLDPASNAAANEWVEADKFYTLEDDGLTQPWSGSVWLNPPYDNVGPWIDRLIWEHTKDQNVDAALLLVNANTETNWFRRLYDFNICFIKGRLKFWNPEKVDGLGAPHGNALIYMGPNPDLFAELASEVGTVVSRTPGNPWGRKVTPWKGDQNG